MIITAASKGYMRLSNSQAEAKNGQDKSLKIQSQNGLNKAGKKNEFINKLIEQKQKLYDGRKSYLDEAQKNNVDAQTIKSRLGEFDEQIQKIDKQINEIKIQQQKEALGTDENAKDKEKKAKDNLNKPQKTNNQNDEELNRTNDMMNSLLNTSSAISLTKGLSAERVSAVGEKNVLEQEISLDRGRGINPIRKRSRVSELEDNIQNIDKKVGENIKDINNISNQNNLIKGNIKFKNNSKVEEYEKMKKNENQKDENEQEKNLKSNSNTENSGDKINTRA